MCMKAGPFLFWTIQIANLATGLVGGIDILITQMLFDSAYDLATGDATYKTALIALCVFAAVKIFANIIEGIRQYAIEVHGTYVLGHMMSLIHKKSSEIDPISYEDPSYLDDINKATDGTDASIYFCNVISFIFTYHIPYFVFLIWYLKNLQPILILCLFFIFVPVLISHLFRSKLIAKLADTSAPLKRQYNEYYNACCGKEFYKETRTLGAFHYLRGLLSQSIKSLNYAVLHTQNKITIIDLLFNSLTLLGYGGVLFLSVKCMLDGTISVGAFAAVITSIDSLFSSIEYLIGDHLGSIAENFGEIRNFLRFLQIPTRNKPGHLINKKDGITVENVSFCYPNSSEDALKNINLRIDPEETVAIVGENGAGKSTLVKLLIGLYTPSEGKISIGGKNLKEVDYKSVFKDISGVFQKYNKYALTLRENIEISDFFADNKDERLDKAIVDGHVDLHNTSLYPEGLDTMLSVEFDGVDLSGGQWQRVAIARGLYRKCEIVVLDEPTASIDPIEESNIYKEFSMIAKNKIAIIVTHRMGAARIADRIIVMKDGEIAECGSHEELLNKNGVYANMFNAQAKWYN